MSTDRPAAAPPSWDDNADEVLVEGMVTAVVVVVLALVSSLTSVTEAYASQRGRDHIDGRRCGMSGRAAHGSMGAT